jgi:hypothetical protein
MKPIFKLSFCILLIFVRHAMADVINQSHVDCRPSADDNFWVSMFQPIERIDTGTYCNIDCGDEQVFCPVTWKGTGSSIDASDFSTVYYRDTDSTTSFSCYPVAQDMYGTSYIGATKYSCATPGGCTVANHAYQNSAFNTLSLQGIGGQLWVAYVLSCTLSNSGRLLSYSTSY